MSEEMYEALKEMSPADQVITLTKLYACGDMDKMDQLIAAGTFQPERK